MAYEDIKLSIIIVNHNSKYLLEQSLYSVRAASAGMDVEILVVDNNSNDGSVEYSRQIFPEVEFIVSEEELSYAKACNQAIARVKGEFVLLLNPDMVIGEESLRSLCFQMDEEPEIGAIGVKMLGDNGAFLPESKRSFPTPWVSFCKMFGLSSLFSRSRLFSRYCLPYLNPNKPHKVEVLSKAFMLLRHEAIDKVGDLDESFLKYGEDMDLSYRLSQEGYKCVYQPERVSCRRNESVKPMDKEHDKALCHAMLNFCEKYFPEKSGLMRILTNMAVSLRSLFGVSPSRQEKKRSENRRLLVICHTENLDEIKGACSSSISGISLIDHWNLDERRVMDAISRKNLRKGYTDFVFYYPDVRFEQMLLFMDKLVDKNAIHHIYTKAGKRLL